MKNNYHKLFLAFTLLFAVSIIFFSSSCQKNKDCKATVTILDATSTPVSGATVTVGPSKTAPQGNLSIQTQSGVTDGSGSVTFTFKLPAILDAVVTPPSTHTCGTSGCTGLVKLEEGKSVTKTININ